MSDKRFIAQVISEGRVTIPKALRKLLDIKDGDLVELILVTVYKQGKAQLDSGPIAVRL